MLASILFKPWSATLGFGLWLVLTAVPTGLAAQDHSAPQSRRQSRRTSEPSRHATELNSPIDGRSVAADSVWSDYRLAPYTMRLTSAEQPERAVVNWIMRETGQETWHGEDPAVLCASRGRLRVFHRPEVQDDVAEIVERFVRPVQFTVSVEVDVVATTDLDWRNGLSHLLKPVAMGDDGQHIWFIAREDASLVRERLRAQRNTTFLAERHVVAPNGAPTLVETNHPVNYISSLELASGPYIGYQPVVSRLHEGVRFAFTPLWTRDGGQVDLNLKLTTRGVRKLHHAQSVAPLSTGNQTTTVQVPEVSTTLLERTVRWPVNQSMLISAGLQPAGPSASRGALRLTTPVQEILILAEIHPPSVGLATKRASESNRR